MSNKQKKPNVSNSSVLEVAIKRASKECCKYLFEFRKYEKIISDEKLLKEFYIAIQGIYLSGRSGILRGGKTREVQDRIKKAQEKLKGRKSWENGCPRCGSNSTEVCYVCIDRVLEEVRKVNKKK